MNVQEHAAPMTHIPEAAAFAPIVPAANVVQILDEEREPEGFVNSQGLIRAIQTP
jgi:hypothetical protein